MDSALRLKVAEAHQDDVNRGIIRLDSSFMRQLGLSVGDAIGVKGERETVAIVDRAYPSDLGLEIVRMDGVLRKNAKISIGEHISLFKVELKPATKVILSPMQDFVVHPATLSNLKKGLQKKPLTQGDIISIGSSSTNDKRGAFSSNNPFAIDLFNVIENDFLGFNLSSAKFKAIQTKPSGSFVYIDENTTIEISNEGEDEQESVVNYEDIGGLKSQLSKVRELVELPLKHPEIFGRLGIEPPKGILLYGPPGTGKTLLARAIANETEASFYSISAPEVVNKFYGESEKKLRELFEKAQKDSPSVVFIDEIDAIAAKREEVQGETEKRIVAQLLTLMDGLKKSKKIIVIAATNRPDAIDEALRRPGRFDRELELAIPKAEDRLEILKIHTRGMPLELPKDFKTYESALKQFIKKNEEAAQSVDIDEIKETFKKDYYKALSKLPEEVVETARKKTVDKTLKKLSEVTHGFVGADLEAFVKEAAFNVLRRTFPEMNIDLEDEVPQEILQKLEIKEEDFREALKVVRPSAMREFLVEVPNVKWEEIGGLKSIKQQLNEMVEWPLKNPEVFKRMGVSAPKGILLYGPPGTGKTLLAKAVATQTSCNFIYVKGPEIINKYVGESEKMIRKLFEKARQNSPSILFFDEFDAIAGARVGGNQQKSSDTIVNQILTEMDGLEDLIDVKVIAATNRPLLIDPALLRPGRFDKLILVDMPDEEARESIIRINTKNTPVKDKENVIKNLAKKTQGYVGADIEALVREAALIALRKDTSAKEVTQEHFDEALKVIRPSVTIDVKEHYENLEKEMKNPKKDKHENLAMTSYM